MNFKVEILTVVILFLSKETTVEARSCGGALCREYLQCSMEAAGTPQDKQKQVRSAFQEASLQEKCDLQAADQAAYIKDCVAFLASPVLQIYLFSVGFKFPTRKFYWTDRQTGNFDWQEMFCSQTPGGHLSKLDSKLEVELLACVTKNTFATFHRVGIGLKYNQQPTVQDKANWIWQDGSKVKLDNWDRQEPNNLRRDEFCAEIKNDKQQWNNVECTLTHSPTCYVEVKAPPVAAGQILNDPTALNRNLLKLEGYLRQLLPLVGTNSTISLSNARTQIYIAKLSPTGNKPPAAVELQNTQLDLKVQTEGGGEFIAATYETEVPLSAHASPLAMEQGDVESGSYVYLRPNRTVYTSVSAYGTSSAHRPLKGSITLRRNVTTREDVVCGWLSSNSSLGRREKQTIIESVRETCAFIDPSTGNSSTVGCSSETSGDRVICKCNHFTVFSVLLAVKMVSIPAGVTVLSYVCESLSIAFLLLSLALLGICKRDIRSDRTILQINLSLALLLLHVSNIAHRWAVENPTACVALAASTHFFLMATVCWFLLDGIRLFMATRFPLKFRVQDSSKRSAGFLICGWSVPALITALALGLGLYFDIYLKRSDHFTLCHHMDDRIREYNRCWLTPGTNLFLLSVVLPVGIVLGANLFFALKSASVLMRQKPGVPVDYLRDRRDTATKFFFLLIVLGGTWILGFFTGINDATSSLAFLYIHTLVNGLQGVAVFYFYCALNPTVRDKVKLIFRPKRPRQVKLSMETMPINQQTQETGA